MKAIRAVVPRLVRGIQRGCFFRRSLTTLDSEDKPRNDSGRVFIIACIRIYRYAFSLLFGHCCRFQPSCSTYAIEAINVHGSLKGCYYALRRVLRCHPWHAGGVDPVPSNHLNQRKRS